MPYQSVEGSEAVLDPALRLGRFPRRRVQALDREGLAPTGPAAVRGAAAPAVPRGAAGRSARRRRIRRAAKQHDRGQRGDAA